jgi:hypothetical protein
MFGECHAHIIMDALNYKSAMKRHETGVDESVIHRHFSAYRNLGISFIRDGGDGYGVSKRAKEIAPSYGIDYRTPIFAIHKNGHYGGIVGRGFDNIKEYAGLVKEVKKQGGDFIKIMTTGIMDFNTDGHITGEALPYPLVKEMVHIAHEEGFAVMTHTNGANAVYDVLRAGADSVEHGNFMDDACIKAFAQSDAVWVPTVTVVPNLLGCGRFQDTILESIWHTAEENIKKAWLAGVTIALGSDAGAYLVPHGQGLLDELRRFQYLLCEEQDEKLKKRLAEGETKIKKRFRTDVN